MDRGTISKAISGGGAWMIAAAFQIIPNTWPTLLRPHPWLVGIFVVVGAAMFIYAAVGHKQSGGLSNSVGRDNSGDLINAKGSSIFTGDINIHPQPVAEELPDRITAMMKDRTEAMIRDDREVKPRIAISAPELCNVSWNRALWQRREKGSVIGAIIWIHNLAAAEGGSRGVANSVSVSLNFKQQGNTVAHLSSAFWIDHIENTRDLGVDARFAILIATFRGPTLNVCNNTRGPNETIHLSRQSPSDRLRTPILKEEIIPATSVIEIKAAVLSKGKTLAESTFHCVRNADNSLTIV